MSTGPGPRPPSAAMSTPHRTIARRLLLLSAAACALVAMTAAPALAKRHHHRRPHGHAAVAATNPLAGVQWGVYTGPYDNSVYPFYQQASGRNRLLLAKIALQPLMFSFGAWYADSKIESTVQQYIANVTGGNPNVLAQVAVFRLNPWEGAACGGGSWGAADQASYRQWIDNFAAGIGSSRVALILQPDLAFAACAPSPVPLQLVSYAAQRFSALPHTTVYIDGGVHYWPSFHQAVWMLERAGIGYVRGFALNTTEYDATGAELEYGAKLAQALAAAGYPGKHFVINTAENGAPFLNGQYPGNVGNPRVCRSRFDRICATLGIPPTANTSSPQWRLSGQDRALAARYADAYVWVGRPWLDFGAAPFDMSRALGLAASSPF
jgi:endoglucanase